MKTKIQGEIKVGGKAVQDGRIVLRSADSTGRVQGRVKDGKYEVEHVRPGRYNVAVRPTAGSADEARIPDKYRTSAQSGLTVQVNDGDNRVDLNLSGK
jgi:hypothetical protein